MRAAWWVGVHIVSVCFHLSWSLRGQVGHTVSCRVPLWPLRRGGGALRAGQDAAGGRAEGVPRSKCVLLEILHPHVQEQAAESLRLARYGPANGWGPGMRAQTRSGTKNSHSAPAKSHAFVCPISCIAAPKIGRGLPLRGPKCFFGYKLVFRLVHRFGRLFVDVTKDTRRFSVKSRSVKIHGSGELSPAASAE